MPSDRPPTRPALPAAVSTLVAAVVHGPPVTATVIAAHRHALYLSMGGGVLPIVTSDAVALPTAVRLAVPSGTLQGQRPRLCRSAAGQHSVAGPSRAVSDLQSRGWGLASGDQVLVGAGRVALPGLDIVAARTWRPARVRRLVPTPRIVCASGGHAGTDGEVRAVLATGDDAQAWLAAGIRAALSAAGCPGGCQSAAVASLVGRGPGLTPSGDDALAGALLVTHALGTGTALADAVRARLGATTAVSAALLGGAADGYAAHPVVALVDAALAGEPDAVRRALPAVLAIGHTSGADTVTGIRAALGVPAGHGCQDGCQSHHFRTRLEKEKGVGRAA